MLSFVSLDSAMFASAHHVRTSSGVVSTDRSLMIAASLPALSMWSWSFVMARLFCSE
jgi:hypothetical protein